MDYSSKWLNQIADRHCRGHATPLDCARLRVIAYRDLKEGDVQIFAEVNWIAVAVGAVFNMALGTLWYGPLFGKLWLKVIGKKRDEIQSSATMYILPLLAGFVASYVLAVMIRGLGITLWWQGISIGIILWLGFGASATLTTGTFEGSPRGAWLLFTLYQVAVYGAQGLMFALWR